MRPGIAYPFLRGLFIGVFQRIQRALGCSFTQVLSRSRGGSSADRTVAAAGCNNVLRRMNSPPKFFLFVGMLNRKQQEIVPRDSQLADYRQLFLSPGNGSGSSTKSTAPANLYFDARRRRAPGRFRLAWLWLLWLRGFRRLRSRT